MNKVGLQVYTIRDVFANEGYEVAFKKIAEAGYTQAQTAGAYEDIDDAKAYAAAAKAAGVEIVGTHYNWEKIRDNVEETVEIHKILGTTNVGIGGMPAEARKDYNELVKFIADFNAAAEKYKAYGMKLTYHNHSFEFVKIKDGKTLMDYLIEGFSDNISFVLDTYWVQHGGADIRRMLERLAGRVDILHLKDMAAWNPETKAPYYTQIGDGNIDMKDIVAVAEATGVKSFVVEQDGNFEVDSVTSIKKSFDYLKANVMK